MRCCQKECRETRGKGQPLEKTHLDDSIHTSARCRGETHMLRPGWILFFHRNNAIELIMPNAMTRDDLGSAHATQKRKFAPVSSSATIITFGSSKNRVERSVRNASQSDSFDIDFSANLNPSLGRIKGRCMSRCDDWCTTKGRFPFPQCHRTCVPLPNASSCANGCRYSKSSGT